MPDTDNISGPHLAGPAGDILEPFIAAPGLDYQSGLETLVSDGGHWDFGKITANGSRQGSMKYKNTTEEWLVTKASIENNSSGAFSTKHDGDYFWMPPGGERTVTVRFSGQGQGPGTKTATLEITIGPSGSYPDVYNYQLIGTVAESPDVGDSHGVKLIKTLGNPVEGTCRLINAGTLPLTITNMTHGGSDIHHFQILGGNQNGTVGPGSSRNIDVRYLAESIGSHDDANLRIEFTYDDQGYHIALPLSGQTDSIPAAQLWLDDTLIAEEPWPVSGSGLDEMTLVIEHPYSAKDGKYADQTSTYNLKRGSYYAINYDFDGSMDGQLLKKRQQKLEAYRTSGLADDSREVICETLNVMGQAWMKQTTLNSKLLAQMSDVISIRHHRFGITAQEDGFYIDVKTQMSSDISRQDLVTAKRSFFKSRSQFASSLEHGLLEQLQVNMPAVSTVKLLQLANSDGSKIFFVNAANWPSVEPQLGGYSDDDIDDFEQMTRDGWALVLPENGQIVLEEWKGKGYISYRRLNGLSAMGMTIGGGYYGGYGARQGQADTLEVVKDFRPEIKKPAQNFHPKSKDPVDMATGAYVFDHRDLSLGGAAPLGLQFSRSYTSRNADEKTALGHGWTHNYHIYASEHSDAEAGLGMRQPADAAALIVASVATLNLMENDPDVKEWLVAALVAKWATDRLTRNAVSIHLGADVLTYIMLPDGSYVPPPGVTTQLVKNEDETFSLQERFGTSLDFDETGRISSWTDADGNVMSFTYIGEKLDQVADAFGRTLEFEYEDDLLDRVSDSASRKVSFDYDTAGNLESYYDAENYQWQYGYDEKHRMTSLTNPLEIVTATNTYDALGRVDTQTVPRQAQAGGSAVYRFYFSDFRNIEEDPDGNPTIYYFDRKGRAIGEENALGHRTRRIYDVQNHVIEQTDARGHTTHFYYDSNHNLVQVVNALGYETDYVYDEAHRQTDVYNPLENRIHYDYDTEHHLLSTTVYPQPDSEITTRSTFYEDDENDSPHDGLLHTTTDGRGTITTMTYDEYGNPASTKIADEPPVRFTYDEIGRMESLTDQSQGATDFEYEDCGLLTRRTDPLAMAAIYEYYNDGRLMNATDRNGEATSYQYTPSGKVDTVTYADESTVRFIYDSHDNLVEMHDSIGTTSYGYDDAHRLTSVTDPHNFVVGYDYDEAGNLVKLTYPGPGENWVIYGYDELNRLESVTINWLDQEAVYEYDNAGRLLTQGHFNNVTSRLGYDGASRLVSMDHVTSDPEFLSYYYFTLDDNGNRVHVDNYQPLPPVLSATVSNYTYDDLSNRLLSADQTTFTHDDEGQLTGGYNTIYTFDDAHRLVGIVGPTTESYAYDGRGNRLQAVRGGITTRYIYDASGNLLAEADEHNNITRYYVYGLGLLAMVTPSDQVYCYHFDAIGNTIAITDENEQVVSAYAYTPFGLMPQRQEAFSQPFTFVGQYGVMSEPNGYYYMRARYYDPRVGRFISEDPLGFDGGDINLYVYAANNPIVYVDPNGEFLQSIIAGGIAGGIIGGINFVTDYHCCPGNNIIISMG